MKRRHKKYSRPRTLYDKDRIEEENKLIKKYGLKNKREIWKTGARVGYLRNRAKKLITADKEEQERFFKKLRTIGLDVNSIADVLALTKEDIMKRRLSSILTNKGIAKTPNEARQMILHKKVVVNNRAINVPSYLVKVGEENAISVKKPIKISEINKSEEAS